MHLRHSPSCLLLVLLTAFTSTEGLAQQDNSRTAWTTSRLSGTPEPPAPYIVERIYPQLQFNQPVILTHLHWDHCQNVDLFRNARVLVHSKELDYARSPKSGDLAFAAGVPDVLGRMSVEPVSDGDVVELQTRRGGR